jgi:hypothetical protein
MPIKIVNITPPPILRDNSLQHMLDTEGYVELPFLSDEALSKLKTFYAKMHPATPMGPIPGFYVSVHSSDLSYKLEIQNEINKYLHPFCEQNFKDYSIVNTALTVKSASPESELIFHQDWNAVDEAEFASYTLWIPLVDTTIENGTLFVAKRTHRLGPTYRSAQLPSIYGNIGSIINKYLNPIEVKAGNAVLFNKAMLHQSPPNYSDSDRPTIVSTVISAVAKHITYAFAGGDKKTIKSFEVANDYMQYYDCFFEDAINLPIGAIDTGEEIVTDFKPIEPQDFEDLYKKLL